MARRKLKTLIPNDFRDFLSIISFMGFIAIFLSFTFDITWLSKNMDAIFLMLGGSAFLVVGKVVTANQWAKDGIQQNEISQLVSIVFGFSAIVIGLFLLLGMTITTKLFGYIGILALVPAVYTFADYIAKNKK